MTRPLPHNMPPAAYISALEAEIRVIAPNGPLSSPETLLAAVRAELLPALSDVLEEPPFATSALTLPHLEIDIGEWPDNPVWPQVRAHLADKLRAALLPYLTQNAPNPRPAPPRKRQDAAPTRTLLQSLGALPQIDQLAALFTYVTGHPDRARALNAELTATPDRMTAWANGLTSSGLTSAKLPDVIDRLGTDPGALTTFARVAPDRDFRDAVALHRGLAPLAHLATQAQLTGLVRFMDQTPNVLRVLARPASATVIRRLSAPVQSALDGLRTLQNPARHQTTDLLAQISTLPESDQMPALLHHLAQVPASLDILRSPAHGRDLALCAATVQTALTMAPARADRAENLAQLAAIMDREHEAPQTAHAWRERAMTRAPELMQRLQAAAHALPHAQSQTEDLTQDQPPTEQGKFAPHTEKNISNEVIHSQTVAEDRLRYALLAQRTPPVDAAEKAARLTGLWSLLALPNAPDDLSRALTDALAAIASGPKTVPPQGDLPNLAALKSLWRTAPADKHAALAARPSVQLRRLALSLTPAPAETLKDRITAFVDDPETPRFALLDLVATLLDGRAIDFEALGTAPSLPEALAALTGIDITNTPPLGPTANTPHTQALQTLIDAALPADAQVILRQIWTAWPTAADAQADADKAQPLWDSITRALLDPPKTRTRTETIAHLLESIEPDLNTRTAHLRVVSARLSLPDPKGDRAVQLAARQVVEAILAPPAPSALPLTPEETKLIITQNAGLVILHPFLSLLFERLGITPEDNQLPVTLLPKAHAVLDALAPTQAPDPIHQLLLGLPMDTPLPEDTVPLDPDAHEMIESLLRAVITQWGTLGATSTDGLRETFLQRPGTLQPEDEKIALRVQPGPFDMLMDAMPWALSPVKLPWMPLPLFVNWRDADD